MKALYVMLAAGALLTAGCLEDDMSPERLDRGLVIILPGIEGAIANCYSLRDGLRAGGVDCGIMIHSWGWPIPGVGLLLNQTDAIGNRAAGKRVAQMVSDYQDQHPGKPVHVIGHSGGGGIAVFTGEGMPEGKQVDGLILLSASISAGYDLSNAVANTRLGIVNFYSYRDGILPNTELVGCVDGRAGTSAGLNGFTSSFGRLYQVGWNTSMESAGNYGGHMDTCNKTFVAQYVAPWVTGRSWPAR